MQNSTRPSAIAFALALPLFGLASCGGGGGGAVVVSSNPPVFFELEPNDAALDANFLGSVKPGDHFFVEGVVHDPVFDPFDGFAFVSKKPCDVEFYLKAHDPGADLDLWLYDPLVDDFVALFETPVDPEAGFFQVLDPGAEIHMVVTPFGHSLGAYTLEVFVRPIGSISSFTAEAKKGSRIAAESRGSRPEQHGRADDYKVGREPVDVSEAPEPQPRFEGTLVVIDPEQGPTNLPLFALPDGSLVAGRPRQETEER